MFFRHFEKGNSFSVFLLASMDQAFFKGCLLLKARFLSEKSIFFPVRVMPYLLESQNDNDNCFP